MSIEQITLWGLSINDECPRYYNNDRTQLEQLVALRTAADIQRLNLMRNQMSQFYGAEELEAMLKLPTYSIVGPFGPKTTDAETNSTKTTDAETNSTTAADENKTKQKEK